MYKKGFTLIELLVSIAIIAILSAIVIASIDQFNEKSRVGAVADQIRELETATSLYITDTATLPPSCDITCVAGTDPFLTAPAGVSRWNGPYFNAPIWSFTHPWKGRVSIETQVVDSNADGINDMYFHFSNDAVSTNVSDNTRPIPTSALQKIDAIIDDGNLATGNARGDGQGFGSQTGELVIFFVPN